MKKVTMGSIIIAAIFAAAGSEAAGTPVPRYADNHALNKTVLSDFSGRYGIEWKKTFGADSVFDTLHNGKPALSIRSTNAATVRVEKIFATPQDFSSATHLFMKCASSIKGGKVWIYLSTKNYAGYAYLSMGLGRDNYFDDSLNFALPFSYRDFLVFGTGFNWSSIDKIRIDFKGPPGAPGTLTVWEISRLSSTLSKGVVLITFDDGVKNQFDSAAPILTANNLKAAFAIVTKLATGNDTAVNYMSVSNLHGLVNQGHELLSHTNSHPHLDSISLDSVAKELTLSNNWLNDNGLDKTGGQFVIYPFGQASDSVQQKTKSYCSIGFSTSGAFPTTPVVDPLFIPRFEIVKTDAVGVATSLVDWAVRYKLPLVLCFHSISSSDASTDSWSVPKFSTFCSYLKSKVDSGKVESKLLSDYFSLQPDTVSLTRDTGSVISRFSGGAGSEWIKVGGNGRVRDTVLVQAIAVSSINNDRVKIEKTFTSAHDLSKPSWFGLKCSATQKAGWACLYFSTNNYAGYAYLNINLSYSGFMEDLGDWNLPYMKPFFEFGGTGFNWSNIDKMRVDFINPGTTNATFTMWECDAGISKLNRGTVILTFDDGWQSQFDNAAPILQNNNLKADFAVVADWVDGTGSSVMHKSHLVQLIAQGHEIASHCKTHTDLNTLSPSDAEAEIAYTKNWLITNQLSANGDIIIYPDGGANNAVQNIANKYCRIGLTTQLIPSRFSTTPFVNNLFIPRYLVDKSDAVSTATEYVDSAIAYKLPLVIGFHAISDSDTPTPTRWSVSNFRALCAYLKAKVDAGQLDVMTIGEYRKVYSEFVP